MMLDAESEPAADDNFDQQPTEHPSRWSAFSKWVKRILAIVAITAALMFGGRYVSDSLVGESRDIERYQELRSILDRLRELQAAEAPDFGPWKADAKLRSEKLATELARQIRNSYPARRKLLIVVRDDLPQLLKEDLSEISSAQRTLATTLDEAALFITPVQDSHNLQRLMADEAEHRNKIAEELERVGATIHWDASQGPRRIVGVELNGKRIQDQHLKRLVNIGLLTWISIQDTGITDAGLGVLQQLRYLDALAIKSDTLSNQALKSLKGLEIKELRVHQCPEITEIGLMHLSNVQKLTLIGGTTSDETLEVLRDFPNLKGLQLQSDEITDDGLELLLDIPQLTSLTLSHCHSLSDAGMSILSTLEKLVELKIHGAKVTDDGLMQLGKLPKLQILSLAPCETRNPDGLPITDAGLAGLENLGNLVSLRLRDCPKITDETASMILEMAELKDLQLKNTGITKAAYRELVQRMPHVHLEYEASRSMVTVEHPELVAEIKERGGRASSLFDEEHITFVTLTGNDDPDVTPEFGDDDLDRVVVFKQLQSLHLKGKRFTDASLKLLTQFSELNTLILEGCDVTEAGLQGLSELENLEVLTLSDIQLTPKGFEYIAALNIQSLALMKCGLNDSNIRLLRDIENLAYFYIEAPDLTDLGLEQIISFQNLRVLTLQHCPITDSGLQKLSSLPFLRTLGLNTVPVTDKGLGNLLDIPKLNSLMLTKCRITDEGLQSIASSKTLEILSIDNCGITDRGLMYIKELSNLRTLLIRNESISDEAFSEYQQERPKVLSSNFGKSRE